MNELIKTLCKIIDFSNLFLVITTEKGIIKSVSDRLSTHVKSKTDEYEDLNGKCWYDFIDIEHRNMVIESYSEVVKNPEECKEIKYPVGLEGNTINIRWVLSFVNHDFNYVMSIGMPILDEKDNNDFETIRQQYFEVVNKDREKIKELTYIVNERRDLISKNVESVTKKRC